MKRITNIGLPAEASAKVGFTLMEVLIAVTIIAILSVIGIVSYSSINKRSRDAKRKSDLEQVRSALEMYRSDHGVYPGTAEGFIPLTSLDPGDNTGPLIPLYLPAIPMDPKSTISVPIPYYYTPLTSGLGTTTFFYYCLCSKMETETGNNSCSVTPPTEANDYCISSP